MQVMWKCKDGFGCQCLLLAFDFSCTEADLQGTYVHMLILHAAQFSLIVIVYFVVEILSRLKFCLCFGSNLLQEKRSSWYCMLPSSHWLWLCILWLKFFLDWSFAYALVPICYRKKEVVGIACCPVLIDCDCVFCGWNSF